MTKKEKAHLDELWSEYIRKRAMHEVHGCQRCLTWKNSWKKLQAAHCFSRKNQTVRWHPLNGAGCCGGCHMYIDSHPDAKFELFRNLIGDSHQFEALYVLSNMTSKSSPIDYKMTAIYLKTLIKQLEGA